MKQNGAIGEQAATAEKKQEKKIESDGANGNSLFDF